MFHLKKDIDMTHSCKVQCYTMDKKKAEDLGIEDTGKWMPFIFNMDIIDAAKMANDEEDSPEFNCTTIYTNTGTTFIIDTPYEEFMKKFIEWNTMHFIIKGEDDTPPSDDDLEL